VKLGGVSEARFLRTNHRGFAGLLSVRRSEAILAALTVCVEEGPAGAHGWIRRFVLSAGPLGNRQAGISLKAWSEAALEHQGSKVPRRSASAIRHILPLRGKMRVGGCSEKSKAFMEHAADPPMCRADFALGM
jgi:hypothetical protein